MEKNLKLLLTGFLAGGLIATGIVFVTKSNEKRKIKRKIEDKEIEEMEKLMKKYRRS